MDAEDRGFPLLVKADLQPVRFEQVGFGSAEGVVSPLWKRLWLTFFLLFCSVVQALPSFELLNLGPYDGPFYGGLHSHTTYAMPNYAGRPIDAWKTARSYVLPGSQVNINAGTDFWGLSDYYWSLAFFKQNWSKTLKEAQKIRRSGFPAIFGWEWSILKPGVPEQRDHINCFPINQINPELPAREAITTLPQLYAFAAEPDHFHVCQFNHPEMRSRAEPLPAFNQFAYNQEGDQAISLIGIRGTGGGFRGYFQALNKGWHVSPANNEDNKDWSWGLKVSRHGTQRRVGVFARQKSVQAIMEGLKRGMTFSTTDKSLSASITVKGDQESLKKYRDSKKTYYMGSVFYDLETVQLTLEASDRDTQEEITLPYYPVICHRRGCSPPTEEQAQKPHPDSPYFVSAYLYSNGGKRLKGEALPLSSGRVVKRWTGLHTRHFLETMVVHPKEDGSNSENATGSVWYVLRLVQADGDQVMTAPIYFHRSNK